MVKRSDEEIFNSIEEWAKKDPSEDLPNLVKNYMLCYLRKGINTIEPDATINMDDVFNAIENTADIVTARMRRFVLEKKIDTNSREFHIMNVGAALGFGKFIDASMCINSYKCVDKDSLETQLRIVIKSALIRYDDAYLDFYKNYMKKEGDTKNG